MAKYIIYFSNGIFTYTEKKTIKAESDKHAKIKANKYGRVTNIFKIVK